MSARCAVTDQADITSIQLRRVAEVIGAAATVRLAERFGGVQTYIPQAPGADHPWAPVIGLDAVRALAEHWPGTHLEIPRGAFGKLKKAEVLRLLEQGLSKRQAALQSGCTDRYVRRLVNGDAGEQAQPQGTLPFGD